LDRRTKERVATELHERLGDFKIAVLAGYSGMDVEQMTALRTALRKANVELRVVKNTLLTIASRDTDLDVLKGQIRGPLALAIARGDEIEATKTLIGFAKKNESLKIKAAVMGGKTLGPEELLLLAELPGREVLLGKLLSVMVGVPTSLVNVLSGVQRSFLQVLTVYRDKKESTN